MHNVIWLGSIGLEFIGARTVKSLFHSFSLCRCSGWIKNIWPEVNVAASDEVPSSYYCVNRTFFADCFIKSELVLLALIFAFLEFP